MSDWNTFKASFAQEFNNSRNEMSEIKDGGPAFPLAHSHVDLANTNWSHANGATLRDYFAAKAMQGICAHPDTWGLGGKELAEKSYEVADAMLAARGQS